ncbi:MAG: cytochrome P450 [Methylobacteriaceae bacterium]|nr:cytochrome P450 [Methylobacteriaceae bacterium]
MTSATLPATGLPTAPPPLRRLGAKDLAHIPGETGWPVVGNTLRAVRDPLAFTNAMHAKYGPVYRNHLLGIHGVTLLGPQANEFVLFDQQRLFSSTMGWAPVLERLFPRGLMLLDFDEHRMHRKALSVAFKSGAMKSYLEQLNRGIEERVRRWIKGGPQFLFYPAIKQLTLDLAATSFIGDEAHLHSEEVNRAFVAMVAAAVTPVRKPIPGTQMYRGVQGRKRIIELFSREIPRRREAGGEDIFSQLCRASYDDGSLLSAQDIIDHMSFLMMAAHDTLTSSMTSLIWFLAKDQKWQQRLRNEAAGLYTGTQSERTRALSYEQLGDLPLTDMAFKEAMRIIPPVPSIPRRSVRAFDFGGYHFPAGTQVSISPLFTHRMPDIWPEPLVFDPIRFSEEASRGRHKFAWVPFGGGAHMCLGLHFAYMQAKCFVYHLLTRAKISVPEGYTPDWQVWPIPKPRDGLPVHLAPI